MKLLPAKELNSKINDQKKSEIDAGLFLAKKIDRLREEVQETQAEHDLAISKLKVDRDTFRSTNDQEKELLLKEIEKLRIVRAQLLLPLDAEWQKVEEESKNNLNRSKELDQQSLENIEKNNKNISFKDYLVEREKTIEEREILSRKNLDSSIEKKNQSEKILLEAISFENRSKKILEIRTNLVLKRETNIAYREVDVENNKKNLLKKERELSLRERRLIIRENANN